MIYLLAVLVMLAVLGGLVLARGLTPQKPTLKQQLDYFVVGRGRTGGEKPANPSGIDGLLATLHGSSQQKFLADLRVAGRSESDHGQEVVKGMLGAAVVSVAVLFIFFGLSPIWMIVALLIGAPLGFVMAEQELRRKAERRRAEFEETLVPVLSLISISMEGGGGLNTAMKDTLSLGDGWVIETLRRTVDEADFRNDTPWSALEKLGMDLHIMTLVELSSTLSLVGTSGARIAQTLASRADAARSSQLIASRVDSEKKSASMGLPLGVMTVAWVLFLAYPAVSRLLSL